MSQEIIQVDAFTDKAFSGNPAGVCIMEKAAEAQWMQNVAKEMNLSETAFLYPGKKEHEYNLRWFTPVVEVDLCGHATLATSHILFTDDHVPKDKTITFQSKSGPLRATTDNGWISLDFPALRVTKDKPAKGLIDALQVDPLFIGRSHFDYLIEVATVKEVTSLKPDFSMLGTVRARGIVITARSDNDFDFISRVFAPAVGIDEDPVTGSAHCLLGPYWSEKLGKDELVGFQASTRGGIVKMRMHGDRVSLSGQAVTTMRGTLTV